MKTLAKRALVGQIIGRIGLVVALGMRLQDAYAGLSSRAQALLMRGWTLSGRHHLIQEQDAGVPDQGAGNSNALLLAARQLNPSWPQLQTPGTTNLSVEHPKPAM